MPACALLVIMILTYDIMILTYDLMILIYDLKCNGSRLHAEVSEDDSERKD